VVQKRLRGIAWLSTLLLLLLSSPSQADQFDVVISIPTGTPLVTAWRIEHPNVKQHWTSYPGIVLQPGDIVSVDAGGCVQTGGHGKTWKRYVDPQGDNSGRLYHGLIAIPGVTAGQRIKDFGLNAPHTIPSTLAPGGLFLKLGYEDDNYGDNGYWSHDDGTGDQCKNSQDAFIVVTIGHGGMAPPAASTFLGIPPDQFRCTAAWQFSNFSTPQLSWESFTSAFDFSAIDYVDPGTYASFLAGSGLASNGDCFGMGLVAVAGENQFVVGDVQEYLWNNYPSQEVPSPRVTFDINVGQWEQMSSYYLTNWIAARYACPTQTAQAIQQDLASGNYGLLSIEHGTEGHILVPLGVGPAVGGGYEINVYDSNRPCKSVPDQQIYALLHVDSQNWSYPMADGTLWTNSDEGLSLEDRIAYVPYRLSDNWRNLLVNDVLDVVQIIFGTNTSVDQVTDASGRKLFRNVRPGASAQVDFSPAGLGRDVIRMPSIGWGGKRPRTAGPIETLRGSPPPAELTGTIGQLTAQYTPDYALTKQVYLVRNLQLNNLEFQLSSRSPSGGVRAFVRRHAQGQWYEARVDAVSAGTPIHPALVVVKPSDLTAGVSVRETSGAQIHVTMTHGLRSQAKGTMTIQQAAGVNVTTSPLRARLGGNAALGLSAAAPQPVTISTRQIDLHGVVTNLPPRSSITTPPTP
jgi:hypothetical protein